jgi:hypothetical protein
MKQVIQLDQEGYFESLTVSQESPLEPGVYLLPPGTIDAEVPTIPTGKRAKWSDGWVFEDAPQEAEVGMGESVTITDPVPPDPEPFVPTEYTDKRAFEYPSFMEYLDGVVKGDQAQIDKYIADCLAVKAKYPKP